MIFELNIECWDCDQQTNFIPIILSNRTEALCLLIMNAEIVIIWQIGITRGLEIRSRQHFPPSTLNDDAKKIRMCAS